MSEPNRKGEITTGGAYSGGTGSRVRGAGRTTALAAPVIATLVVLLCTAFLAYETGGETPRPVDFADGSGTPRPFLAVLVAQLADCESAARSLAFLNRPELRARVRMGTLLLGDEREVARVSEVVRDQFGDVPVRVATRRNRQALRAIGVRATPHLVVLDRAGTVVFTASPPRDAPAADRLRLTLASVTAAAGRTGGED